MHAKTLITNLEFERMAAKLGPCELIDGEIITMSPASPDHAFVENNIAFVLTHFVKGLKLGRVLTGEVGMHVKPGRSRGADVAYVSYKRLPDVTRQTEFLRVPPELIVEVKSDDMSWLEMEEKIKDYHAFGVDMVWVADPLTRSVRKYPLGAPSTVVSSDGEIDGDLVLPGFRVAISAFFS